MDLQKRNGQNLVWKPRECNQLVKDIHDRMPVILKPEEESVWLDKSITDTGPSRPTSSIARRTDEILRSIFAC